MVENWFKKVYGEKLIVGFEKTLNFVVGTHWNLPHRGNSNMHLQHKLRKIRKKTIWK